MGPTTRRLIAGMMTGAAAIVVLAGCGDDGGTDSADASTATESTDGVAGTAATDTGDATNGAAKGAKPVSGLVLTAADLPAGYQAMPVPKEQMQQAADGMLQTAKGANLKPAKCAPPTAVPKDVDVSDMGMLMAMSGGKALSEVVTVGDQDLNKMRKNMTGDCAKISGVVDTQGQKVTTTITYEVVDVPKGKADSVFAVRQRSVAEVGGQKIRTTVLNGWAVVSGYTIAVTSGGSMATPDDAAFRAVLGKGIDKVAAHG